MNNSINKSIFAALSFLLVLAFSPVTNATENPFGMSNIDTQQTHVASNKCGEGKCGDSKKKEAKCGEGKCGDSKKKEGKCGDSKKKEAKCGEGKCGASKKKESKCGG